MNLYIKVVDGNPVDHPLLEANLLEAFPEINLSDPACGYAPFQRIQKPLSGVYQVYVGHRYAAVDGVYQDVWDFRDMTAEERALKIANIKAEWVFAGFPSWVFNETECRFEPPLPYPTDDSKRWFWDEDLQQWV